MHAAASDLRRSRLLTALTLAIVSSLACGAATLAFAGGWTTPKRILTHDAAPSHEMTTDGAGRIHVASDRGSQGVWYVTNASGTWTSCQVSQGDDRRPSISLDGSVVHIAFARQTDGERGIYTASSDQPGPGAGCGWGISQRHAGTASHSSLQARGGTLSIAFRTGNGQLRFIRGAAGEPAWSVNELIDGSCCTSAVALALTDTGSPRVAYGDGKRSAEGLKFGVRTSKGWKKAKAHGGRVTQVALTLDQTPGLFGQRPSNSPRIAYVVKKRGAYLADKGSAGTSGGWSKRFLGSAFGPLDLTHHSNVTFIVYTNKGSLGYARASGGIWFGGKLSGGGKDGGPQLAGGQLTFTRKGPSGGVFYTRST